MLEKGLIKFINAYYRVVDDSYINQLYNGRRINAPYDFLIEDNHKLIFNLSSMDYATGINDATMSEIEHDILSTHDIVDELLRFSDSFLLNGLFEMSVMNLAMAAEAFIKTYVLSHGIKKQELEDKDSKALIDKYYHKGLKLITEKSLKEEKVTHYRVLRELIEIRNTIAHGGNMYEMINIRGKSNADIYDMIFKLKRNVKNTFE